MGLTGCCGCFNLRDGSMAVGVTMLVFSCLQMLGVIIAYALLGSGNIVIGELNEDEHAITDEQRRLAQASVKIVEYALIPAVIIVAVLILINSLLLHGVPRDIKGMILAWLITYGIVFGLAALGSASNLIMSFVVGEALVIVFAFLSAGFVALFWYWWAVVLTHYKSVTDGAAGFNYRKDVMLS